MLSTQLYIYLLAPDFPKLILIYSGAPFFLLCFFFGLFAQVSRYRVVSNPLQRQQTKWVLFGFLATVFGMSLVLLPLLLSPSLLTNSWRVWYLLFSTPVTVLSMTLLPLSITLSILRYRLWDIDVIIRRTLVYGVLTSTLGLVYFASVVVLQQVFRRFTGETSPLAVVLSTLAIAALFTPFRRRIQEGIDRRFYRRRFDAEQTLQAFAVTMRDEVDLDQLKERLLAIVQETMQPDYVNLWIPRKVGKR